MRRWEIKINVRLRGKCDSITSVLLYGLPLLALQLFSCLVLFLFFVLDSSFLCCHVLDFPLVYHLFLLVLEYLLLCCLVLYPRRFIYLQLFYCLFLCLVQLFLILHLQLLKHLNKPCQMSLCTAIQLALKAFFVYFHLLAYCSTKPTVNRLLI